MHFLLLCKSWMALLRLVVHIGCNSDATVDMVDTGVYITGKQSCMRLFSNLTANSASSKLTNCMYSHSHAVHVQTNLRSDMTGVIA